MCGMSCGYDGGVISSFLMGTVFRLACFLAWCSEVVVDTMLLLLLIFFTLFTLNAGEIGEIGGD